MQKLNMIRVNIYLSKKQKSDVEKLSEKTGAPVAELVRRALDAYLKEHNQSLLTRFPPSSWR